MNKKHFILVNAAIQAAFAMAALCNRNPDVHMWCISPIIAAVALLLLYSNEE